MADIKELMQVRRDKMQKLIDNGVNVHPERYERTHQIKEARLDFLIKKAKESNIELSNIEKIKYEA